MSSTNHPLSVLLVGRSEFTRKAESILRKHQAHGTIATSILPGAWASFVELRPHVIIIAIDNLHSEHDQVLLREFLGHVRERELSSTYVAIALLSLEKLAAGGDLLFKEQSSLEPSLFVDTFIALPPGALPSIPSLESQLDNLLDHVKEELWRRAEGRPALPPLCANGWVQSLADPVSRDLWMRWLPRYAEYLNENPVIVGETGTGKTNLAYAIHLLSGRKGSFVTITPRDFSSSELVQAELFGSVQGAYTGAIDRWGLVRSAEQGTLFIDELQSIDKDLQGKIITFIENKAYRRVGSPESTKADVRFVFASNKALPELLQRDILREDFVYRLERVELNLPPLRERPLDVIAALAYSLAKVARQRPHSTPIEGFTPSACALLLNAPWPGNLRQLENTAARLTELADVAGASCINHELVSRVAKGEMKLADRSFQGVIVRAASKLCDPAVNSKVHSIDDAALTLKELMYSSALDLSGGDHAEAGSILGESASLLDLIAQKHLADKEGV